LDAAKAVAGGKRYGIEKPAEERASKRARVEEDDD